MKRQRVPTRNDEKRPVKTPKQIRHPNMTDDQRLFCWLYAIIGMTQAESYKLAFGSKAALSSCSAMSSRMLQETYVREYLHILDQYFNNYPLEVKVRMR